MVGTISNVLAMEIGWTDVGSGGYILVSFADSNTSCDVISSYTFQILSLSSEDFSNHILIKFI